MPGLKSVVLAVLIGVAAANLPTATAWATPLKDGDIFVLDSFGTTTLSNHALFKIDRSTGDRTLVSQFGVVGSGPNIANGRYMAFDPNGQIIIPDFGSDSVFRVDPHTGNRTRISGAGVGSGDVLENPRGVAIAANGDIFVNDAGYALVSNDPTIVKIDPVTGDRAVISGRHPDGRRIGSGIRFFRLDGALTIGPSGDLFLPDSDNEFTSDHLILRVDSATGDRTVVSHDSTANSGPDMLDPRPLAFGDGELFVGNSSGVGPSGPGPGAGDILRVDLGTGVREVVSTVVGLTDLAFDDGELLAVGRHGVFSIDLDTGGLDLITDGNPAGGLLGGGPNFGGGHLGLAVFNAGPGTPVPEPGTLALLCVGLGALGLKGRRRRKAP